MDPLAGRVIGGFEVVRAIGHGTFGTVYVAVQERLDREVALKVLDPVLARDPDVTRRFLREAASAARLDHPSIVPVYRAGDDGGMIHIAMRLVRGETLATLLDRAGGSLDRREVAAVVDAVGAALDHAHAAGLVHRDVKPSNILVEGSSPSVGHVFLADFGIAAGTGAAGTATAGTHSAEALGTASYMAPEQADGGALDGRADLYSLGCVAYEGVTGRRPFEAPTVVGVLVAHRTQPVPTTGDADLDGFFAIALAKDPADRFASGAELAHAFAALPVPSAGRAASGATPGSEATAGRPGAGRGVLAAIAAVCLVAALAIAALLASARRDDTSSPPTAGTTQERGAIGTADVTSSGGTGPPSTPATTARIVVAATTSATGPARLSDPNGISYDLPAGWRTGAVRVANGFTVALHEGELFAIQVTSRKTSPGGIDELAASISTCATSMEAGTLAGLPARHCQVRLDGETEPRFDQWLTTDGNRSWFVLLALALPPEQRQAFLDGVTIP